MSIRLYPIAKSTRDQEILANVPAGTSDALRKIDQRHPNRYKTDEAFAAWWQELDPDARRFETFLSEGWGGVSQEFASVVFAAKLNPFWGTLLTSDAAELVAKLLSIQSVPNKVLPHIKGIVWY
ncbi:MAG: hypothetical protein RBS68_15895 [Anaerolineales bacterium]|jgi:hypothetical protein|nr:hypothetical protein [Anaerolineales bacterium]